MVAMRWDETKLNEIIGFEAQAAKELEECAEKCNAMHASDKPWDDGRLAAYSAEEMRHGQLTRKLESLRTERHRMELLEPEAAKKSHNSALGRFLRSGYDGLEADEIKAIGPREDEKHMAGGRAGDSFILRADTASDAASGQEAVQEDIQPRVIDKLSYYGGIAKMAQQFMTGTGGEWRYIQENAAGQYGTILGAQNTAVAELDIPNLGVVTFNAKTATSGTIGLTLEMVQDAVFDIETYVERQAVRRLGRAWDRAFTVTQTGTGLPVGVVNSATAGITAASASAVTADELSDLEYSINRAYREGDEMGEGGFMGEMGGRIGYLMSDSMEQLLRKLKDGDNRPLWLPSIRDGVPNTIYGRPYEVSGHMAAVASGAIPLLFGNFSYYGIRTVRNVEIYRFLDSRTMQNYAVECLAFSRRDGRPIGVLTGALCDAWAKLTMG